MAEEARKAPRDRRSVPRAGIEVPVGIRFTDQQLTAISRELSVAGILVATNARVKPGTLMRIDFRLPAGAAPLAVLAKLRRADRSRTPPTWFLEFVELQQDQLALIDRYVRNNRSDLPFSGSDKGRAQPARAGASLDETLSSLYSTAIDDVDTGNDRKPRRFWQRRPKPST